MRIVLDTNVLVSGLLSPTGPPGRIVDLVLAARLCLSFDDRILAEYRDVLARPRLRIDLGAAAAVLDFVEHSGMLIPAAPLAVELPDADDLPFLEVAVAGAVDALVTGNQRHYVPRRGSHGATIQSPADFLARWLSLHPRG